MIDHEAVERAEQIKSELNKGRRVNESLPLWRI